MRPGKVIVTKHHKDGTQERSALVKFKGVYIPEEDIPPRVRHKVKFAFFDGVLEKLTPRERDKIDMFLRSEEANA